MASTIGLIWSRIFHDLTLYEHETTIAELRQPEFAHEETPEERAERLHTEVAGDGGLSKS